MSEFSLKLCNYNLVCSRPQISQTVQPELAPAPTLGPQPTPEMEAIAREVDALARERVALEAEIASKERELAASSSEANGLQVGAGETGVPVACTSEIGTVMYLLGS